MKHFQHFPKRSLLTAKEAAFAQKQGGNFFRLVISRRKSIREKDNSTKDTLKNAQVALADSVHVGEKIANCLKRISEKKFLG